MWSGGVGTRVGQSAVECGGTRCPEGRLRHAEFVRYIRAPFGGLLLHDDLLIRVVELDGEFGGEDGQRWRRDAAVPAYLLLRQRRLRPSRLRENLSIKDLWDVCIEQGYGVGILRIVGGGVEVGEGV